MELSAMGPPAAVWQRWTLVAAEHAALGRHGAAIRPADGCAQLTTADGAWLRMRRLVGDRAVVWGHHADLAVDPRFADEVRDSAPDWAWDPDTPEALATIGFLAWHAHGQWWSVPGTVPRALEPMLERVGSQRHLLARWQRTWPEADEELLRAITSTPDRAGFQRLVGAGGASRAVRQVELGRRWTTSRLSRAAAEHLRAQVHAQMRSSPELDDRRHPPRPPLLRQWARVNAGRPFRHAVTALGVESPPGLRASGTNNGLTTAQARSLDNVLLELRLEETGSTSGAWLFARVTGDGRTVALDRAYDSWPAWYDGHGPAMVDLQEEMAERSRAWRPPWSGLLPNQRY